MGVNISIYHSARFTAGTFLDHALDVYHKANEGSGIISLLHNLRERRGSL